MTEELNNEKTSVNIEEISELLDTQEKIVEELLNSQERIVEELLDSQEKIEEVKELLNSQDKIEELSNPPEELIEVLDSQEEREELFDVEGTIQSSKDSENLVKNLVSAGEHNDDIHATIKRNIDHLSIILSKKEIQESHSQALVGFQEAIDLGSAFISKT